LANLKIEINILNFVNEFSLKIVNLEVEIYVLHRIIQKLIFKFEITRFTFSINDCICNELSILK